MKWFKKICKAFTWFYKTQIASPHTILSQNDPSFYIGVSGNDQYCDFLARSISTSAGSPFSVDCHHLDVNVFTKQHTVTLVINDVETKMWNHDKCA